MTQFQFKRRKNYRSYSILLSIIIIVILLVFIPQMLISRSKSVLRHKLDTAQADTTFVHLYQAAVSYLETADAFVIFRSQTAGIYKSLQQKAMERFKERCAQIDTLQAESFCRTWKKILSVQQLKTCSKCAKQ